MPENDPHTKTRRSVQLWASRAAKFLLFLAALISIGWLAFYAADVLYPRLSVDRLDLGSLSAVAGTVLGLVLGFIKRTFVVFGRLCRWMAAPGWLGFLSHVSAFSVMMPLTVVSIVFSLTLGHLLLKDRRDKSPDESPLEEQIKAAMEAQGYTTSRAKLLDRLVWVEPRQRNESEDGRRFPIMFERGRIAEDDDSTLALTEDVSDVRFSAGLGFAGPRDRSLIATLVRALAPCGASGTSGPVVLRVEGYASSEPFERAEGEVSRRLNLHLANERRRVVESELRAEARRLGVEGAIELADAEDYSDIAEMEEDRRFNDRPADSPARGDYDQDLFTRSAHIRILDLSACSYGAP